MVKRNVGLLLIGLVAFVTVATESPVRAQAQPAANTGLPTVVVLATGGTIAGAAGSDVQAAYKSGQARSAPIRHFVSPYRFLHPDLREVRAC